MTLAPGGQLGPYVIGELIGRGGMATVYKAYQSALDRYVAVKVLPDFLAAEEGFRERFRIEARAIARLQHPNIPAVFDYFDDGQLAYLVTELVEGGTMAEWLGAPMGLAESTALLRPVASALDYAHANGVLHRDVKPSNILINRDGRPMLNDFGLARMVASDARLTRPGHSIGTPEFMAPEQCGGGEAGPAADIYSLAAVAYYMLTGRLPFTAPDPISVLVAQVNNAPPSPRSINPDLTEEVEAGLLRGLAKAPENRFPSATDLVDALGEGAATRDAGLATSVWSGLSEPPHNLPPEMTSFVGREAELAELTSLLNTTRMLTLTGPGGTGKTRLSLALARGVLGRFRGGAWFVDLSPLSQPALVPQAVATALGVREASGKALTDSITDHLAERDVLLVIDNCEQVIEAAADLAESLLRGCPGLRILATSRERLKIPSESAWPVPPMPLPDADQDMALETLEGFASIRLFVERARAIRPGFTLSPTTAGPTLRLCRQLDGIPLAIELAAARVDVLSVQQIVERLQDRFHLLTGGSRTLAARQRTLEAAVDWSYELLDERERVLWRRLSVFVGGFDLEGAEAVCPGGDVDVTDVLDLLDRLVGKSLVVSRSREDGATRFRLLETLREYGGRKLVESGELEAVSSRHADFFLALGDRVFRELRGSSSTMWMARVVDELGNFRTCFEWCMSRRPPDAVRLVVGLGRYFETNSKAEGREWLARALAGSDVRDQVRAHALYDASFSAMWVGAFAEGRRHARESLEIATDLGSDEYMARALNALATIELVECAEGWADVCLPLYAQAEQHARAAKDPQRVAVVLNNYGQALAAAGQMLAAREKVGEALAVVRALGEAIEIAETVDSLASIELLTGETASAGAHWKEALQLAGDGSSVIAAAALAGLARVAMAMEQPERFLRLLAAARSLQEVAGLAVSLEGPEDADREQRARALIGEEAADAAWLEGSRLTLAEAIQMGLAET